MSQPYPPKGVGFVAGSDTSEAAADDIAEKLTELQQQVYAVFVTRGAQGATDGELEVVTGMKHQTASARRRELELMGLVVKTPERRVNPQSESKAAVYVLGEGKIKALVKKPKPPAMRKGLNEITAAVTLAQEHGFEPSDDLRNLWRWVNSQVGD